MGTMAEEQRTDVPEWEAKWQILSLFPSLPRTAAHT